MIPPVVEGTAVGVRSPWRLAWQRLRRNRFGTVCGFAVVAMLAAVTVGPPVAEALLGHGPNDPLPYAVDFNAKPAGPWTRVPNVTTVIETDEYAIELPPPPQGTPSTLLIFGGDGPLGRDLFLRVLYGGQVSLAVAVGAALLAVLFGASLGGVAAYFGGWVDLVVGRLAELAMAFPVLLLLLMISSTGNPLDDVTLRGLIPEGVLSLITLIALFTWFYPARIVRARILTLRQQEFVVAAEMVGSGDARILRTHLLPHVVPELLVYGTLAVATNIMLEAGISFFNAGIKLPTASWGTMLSYTWGIGLQQVTTLELWFQPWTTVIPSLAIFSAVLAINQFGEALGEALGPSPLQR